MWRTVSPAHARSLHAIAGAAPIYGRGCNHCISCRNAVIRSRISTLEDKNNKNIYLQSNSMSKAIG